MRKALYIAILIGNGSNHRDHIRTIGTQGRQVAVLSVDIAEKIIRRNLDEKHEQMEMIDRMLDEMLAANH